MILLTAFVLGLATSLHCVGMCGPLMLAAERLAPANKGAWWARRLPMHLGRALSYSALGATVGSLGYGLQLATAQQTVSLLAGVLMVSLALMVWVGHTPALPGAARLSKWVGGRLGNLLAQAKTPSGSFAVGVLNGLLPCGAVYVALAGALGTAHPVSAAAFMAVFGLGTAPALLGMGWLSQRLSGQRLHRWSLGLTLATGLLLTVRGLGLGIPYLSPSVQGSIASAEHPACATDPSGGFSCCRPATSPAPAP